MPIVLTDRGWTFCEKCRASSTHGLGYDYDTRKKVKICGKCGHTSECKPKRYPLDRYDPGYKEEE